jgi:hypothetical protein
MKSILTPEPGIVNVLHRQFRTRVLPRGPIVFLGPFTDEEINQARLQVGLRPLKKHRGKAYRDGTYYAVGDLKAPQQELLETFKTFLDEVSLEADSSHE